MCEYRFLFILCQNVMYYCAALSTVFDWISALLVFIIIIIIVIIIIISIIISSIAFQGSKHIFNISRTRRLQNL